MGIKRTIGYMNENTTQRIVETTVYRKLYQGFFERKVGGVVIKTNRVDAVSPNLQSVHTPYDLCHDMVVKLGECSGSLAGKEILVFNLEFAEVLLNDEGCFGAEASRITFVTDCLEKFNFSRNSRYAGIKREFKSFDDVNKMEFNMKFDVVIMNPPYQPMVKESLGGSGSRNTLWDKFVLKALELVVKDGFVCAVHPAKWRKPEDYLYEEFRKLSLKYLSIHNKQEGDKVFGATTRFDWYILQNKNSKNIINKTIIHDETGKTSSFILNNWPFIPNYKFDVLVSILAKDGEKTCPILYSGGAYDSRRPHMSLTKHDNFIYPCVTSTCKKGVRFCYSDTKSKGLFQISKLIFCDADTIQNAIVDVKGEYAMTPNSMAIEIESEEEGLQIKKAIESKKFNEFLKACRWSNFRIEWRLFKHFRKDFWKEFI
jgi:hypothetical protein